MTDEQLAYRWTVHLARQMPERLPVVVLVLLGAPLLGGMLMGHWLFGLVAFWMLFSATADYLLPIRYEADAQGVRQRGLAPRVMRWEQVKRVVWGEQGVLLSPLAHPSRLDAYRGIFLWYGDQRDQIEQLVRAYCRAAESQSKSARKKRKRGEVSRYA
ncbi:MAG: hypothetical protein N2045_12010 [Fimbriimonadales bacterium]|jgi:hypothetical protein|nr:hypothetical protein [Fimbriimonadales bacterium]GIV13162.1 MAG: hypothetical protein KatS3mg021_1444 [Fimbriimonadales bacterium]CUU09437.1 hypothetical protein GBSOP10_105934 [Armatimonadetes bacterium GBS]CUU36673.1 hypothetical protein GXSOP10_1273 [Armatimonadetes bacterium GXS]